MKKHILLFQENIMYQDSSEMFKYKIEFKFN